MCIPRRSISSIGALTATLVLLVAPCLARAAVTITAKPENLNLKVHATTEIFVYARGGGWPGISGISSRSCLHVDRNHYPDDILAVIRTDQSKGDGTGTVSLSVRAQNTGRCWVKFSAGEGNEERSVTVHITVSP